MMGSDRHYPKEALAHRFAVEGFWIDRYAVTNAGVEHFVAGTSDVTLAERNITPRTTPAPCRNCWSSFDRVSEAEAAG